jgi:SAM-dependent methyltransferase
MDKFEYSEDFEALIIHLHRGKEDWPNYHKYIRDHLGGPDSRVMTYMKYLCPEIEYHCGTLKGKRVLDFGCGTGATTAALAYFCEQVRAFDTDEESTNICRRRLKEHGLETRVSFSCADDIDEVKDSLGAFDLILINGVIEHIPLSKHGLRRRIILSLFQLLKSGGYLYINDTPNRLLPFDFHSTQLWWIPWTKPGSQWAYRRAIRKRKYFDAAKISKGPLGLEEAGAWGATYCEITGYLRGEEFVCLNLVDGHNRHLYYMYPRTWYRSVFEFVTYYFVVKPFHIPMDAFAQSIPNLVIRKRS